MGTLLKLILLISLSVSSVLTQIPPNAVPIATADSAVSASYSVYYEFIEPKCVDSTSGTGTNIGQYPNGQSIENFIAFIEKLEYAIENSSQSGYEKIKGAEQMARILLRRFRFDGFDETVRNSYKNPRDKLLDDINNAFLGFPDIDHNYYFPDYVYTEEEKCSMFYMLSHNIINATQTRRQYNPTANPQFPVPVASHFLNTRNASIMKEEGVVSFRAHKNEAIAPARVLIGIIAALAQNVKTQVKDVVGRAVDSNYDKAIDPILAMTLADLWGSGTSRPSDEKSYFYGVNGEWTSTACTSYYGLTSVPADKVVRFNKGTKAEIRGGIDGYLIGKSLFKLGTDVRSRLKLSTILRSYYSRPKVSKNGPLSISYCDRNSLQQSMSELTNTAQLYWVIQAYKSGGPINPNLLPEFSSALSSAQSPESGGDYCTSMSSALDKGSPCETPSDVIFIIDGQSPDKLQQSGDIVAAVSGSLTNIRAKGGAVSIFLNSQQKSNNPDVRLPPGPGDWPLGAAAFNSTSAGCASCRVYDFKLNLPQPVANMGKLFQYLNQTLFNYEWWTPRTNDSAIPAKSVVLIDLGSVPVAPDSGQDRVDYNNYKDQLRYRHRDVKYLSAATNQDLFKDILRDENDKANPGPPGSTVQFGSDFARKICENPATFQYNECHNKSSKNVQYVGYVTPGYKQNWAMYPKFFHKSSQIEFIFKADDGEIKVCYDRSFPPEKVDYCHELKQGEEEKFNIHNPCDKKTVQTCDPLYFTVWGKGKSQEIQCLDEKCSSLDQIKFTVTYNGVKCGKVSDTVSCNGEDPKPEVKFPCKIIKHMDSTFDIVCAGNQIKNLTSILEMCLSEFSFRQLIINGTSLESIDLTVFSTEKDATFEYIFITDNPLLTEIKTFVPSSPVVYLKITDSPKLTNTEQLFSFVNNLKVKEQIILKNLGIEEIPDFVFENNDNLFSLIITDNPIKRIGKSPFHKLPNLQTLSLKNNNISYIDENGLSFNLGNKSKSLQLILDNNLLSEKSFNENWSNIKRGNPSLTTVNFSFDYNKIVHLPENIFKFILLDNIVSYLSFDGNGIVCDCKIGYLVRLIESYKEIESKLKNVFCTNLSDRRNLLKVKESDLAVCHF